MLMNVSRRASNGEVDTEEVLNKSQVYITSAGFKDSFAYQKQIQLLLWQIMRPGIAFVFGGSWRIPVRHKLLDKGFVRDMKSDGTFNELSFEREYESIWSGTMENAFFNGEQFDKYRQLLLPEDSGTIKERSSPGNYYIFGVDVGRQAGQSVVTIFKVVEAVQGASYKHLVNIFTLDNEHFEEQCLAIKKLYYKFKPKAIAVDGNGLGAGLVDYLVTRNLDKSTGEEFPAFGVVNDERGEFRKIYGKDPKMESNVLYIIKANADINNDAHVNALTQISSGKVRFLVDERAAKAKLLSTRHGKEMTPEQRQDRMRPYVLTSILKEEMMNLREKRDGKNVILEKANTRMGKDKFSSFEYGLYYIKLLEDNDKKKRGKFKATDFMFFS